MNETNTNQSNPSRSGSDTASAAKISAGTSVGSPGQPPTPGYRAPSDSTGQGSSQNWLGQSQSSQQGGIGDMARKGAAEGARQTAQAAMAQASDWAEQGAQQLDYARARSAEQFRRASGSLERFINENPLMVGIMGLAAGLVIGALLPRTRQEDRAFGRWADEVRDQGLRYAREATQRGREFVEEALSGTESEVDSEGNWRREERSGRSSGPRYQNH